MKKYVLVPSIVALVVAAGSFALSRVLWPDLPDMPMPTGAQLPYLMGVGIFESLAFGVGVSFLIFGWNFLKGKSMMEWLAFLSTAWLLVSWWPHDNLHRTTAMGDYWGLIRLEWGFHVTLVIAGAIVAWHLWKEYESQA